MTPSTPALLCSVDGCTSPRQGARRMCSSHYMRKYRHGDPHARPPLGRRPTPRPDRTDRDGYILTYRPSHPLARADGWVPLHRAVMFDELNASTPPSEPPDMYATCDFCGHIVWWEYDLEVHHENHNRADNSLDNLYVSCHQCNMQRRS